MASAHLSTILALAGGAANEDTPYGTKLRSIGMRSFRETVGPQDCGLQILFGIELGTPDRVSEYLSGVKLRCWAHAQPVPETYQRPENFSATAGLAELAWGKSPGPYWLSIELPDQRPVVFATAVLPNRLTMLVYNQDVTGQIKIYQYLPSLAPEEPSDPRYHAARFPVLRRLELIQRSYMTGRLDQAYQNAAELLNAKWVDPMAGCLGGYLLLKLGKANELAIPVGNLTNYFSGLSDSHVLNAEYLASQGREDQAVQAFRAALDRGLPILSDGLARLVGAIQRYQIQHPRAVLTQEVFNYRVRGLLWSASIGENFQPGQPLRF